MTGFKFKFAPAPAAAEPNEKQVSTHDVRTRARGCGHDGSPPELEEWAREILNEVFPGKFEKPAKGARLEPEARPSESSD